MNRCIGASYKNVKRIRLKDIAGIERSVKGRIYPKGTIFIQVSACRRSNLEHWFMLDEESRIESKYAVIEPLEGINPYYLQIALERSCEAFMHRYVGTNINIQMDSFNHYTLDYHPDRKTQNDIADSFMVLKEATKAEEKQIERLMDLKSYLLQNMMAQ